jgi:hypothetical protein
MTGRPSQGWDQKLPCLNTACKNHGSPHPNCTCYQGSGAFAEGGDVGGFCSTTRAHMVGCEHYADGGDVAPSWDSLSATSPTPTPDTTETPAPPEAPDWNSLSTATPTPTPNESTPETPDWDTLSATSPSPDEIKYGTPGQQAITGLEGAAEGLISKPLSVALETQVLGVDPNAIKGREDVNPGVHTTTEAGGLIGGMFLGTGEAGMLAKGVEGISALNKLQELGTLGRLGSSTLRGMIQSGVLQTGDEVGDYMLGRSKDPSAVAANILTAGALGGAIGFGTGGASELLKKIPDAKIAEKMKGAGVGLGWSLSTDPNTVRPVGAFIKALGQYPFSGVTPAQAQGIKFGASIGKVLTGTLLGHEAGNVYGHGLGLIQAKSGYDKEGIWGAVKGAAWGEFEGLIGRTVSEKVALPMLMKTLQSGTFKNIIQGLDNAKDISGGVQKINAGVGNLFKIGTQQGVNAVATEREKEKLKKYIESGQQNQDMNAQLKQGQPQGFAEGGEVTAPEPTQGTPILEGSSFMATHYPELSTVLGTAKARVNSYLNGIRPLPNGQQLPFDAPPLQAEQKRSYDKALGIAVQPLSVLNHVKEGTLTPEHVTHLNGMYPELYSHLQKKILEKVSEGQLDGEKPNYRVRQGLSMMMAAPLSSEMTPMNIQAAQGSFSSGSSPQVPPNPPVTKSKKNTSKLGDVAKSYMTGDQAAASRSQNVK